MPTDTVTTANPDNTTSKQWLSQLFHSSARPAGEAAVGIEVERLALWSDGEAWHYRARKIAGKERPGAQWLLTTLAEKHGWERSLNDDKEPLGLISPHGKVSLEPGSQVELSTYPLKNILLVKNEVEAFEKKVAEITEPLSLRWLTLGVHPTLPTDLIDIIPSSRYSIMNHYFGKNGALGTSMMRRTASVQVNLDYTSEAEAIEMLRAALVLAPLSYALFGYSPFCDSRKTNYLSYRGTIWRHTDPSRTGLMTEAFQPEFNFDRYVDYLWERPLMFAQDKSGQYIPGRGVTLEEIAKGKLSGAFIDENNQMNSVRELFTEARLKPGYIEIRSIDGQSPEMRYAASAFWLGILYHPEARQWAIKTFGSPAKPTFEKLWNDSIVAGLKSHWAGEPILPLARKLLEFAHITLKSRQQGEESLLNPLIVTLEKGYSAGEELSRRFEEEWSGKIQSVIEFCTQRTV